MGKLTKRTIEALAPRDVDYIAWDNDIPGFGVRVMPSGRKSFVLQYRTGRRPRRCFRPVTAASTRRLPAAWGGYSTPWP